MNSQTVDVPQDVLRLENIHKSFGGVVAIEDFSLDLKAGEIVALVGDNGAGKSTLIKIISGVYTPTTGTISFDGDEVNFKDATQARASGIEVVYQDLALADEQAVYMNMFLGREQTRGPLFQLDRKKMIAETEQLVEDLDVRIPSARTTIRNLSGGQRQRAQIAMIFAQDTTYMLLDEPLNNLDLSGTQTLMRILRSLSDDHGKIIVIVVHDINIASRYADRIIAMKDGQIARQGSPIEVIDEALIRDVFQTDAELLDMHGSPIVLC